MKGPKKKRLSKPVKTIEMRLEKEFEKDRERIERFDREHRRFLLALFRIVLHVKVFLKKNTEDNINALSGQSAFFIILSSVPLLMLVLSLIALFGGRSNLEAVKAAAQETFSGHAAEAAESTGLSTAFYQFIYDAYVNASSGIVIVTAVMALWSAGKGLYIITDGISLIYRLPRKHTWLLRRVFAMGYTIVLLIMMTLYFGLLVLNRIVGQSFEKAVSGAVLSTEILYGLRYVIMTVVLALFLTLALKLYLQRKVTDKRYTKFRVLLPGMAFTAIAWDVLAWGVDIYSRYSSSTMYGSLGTVFIIMMWIYFMMLLLLYGVQINYIYRERFCQFRLRTAIAAFKYRRSRNNAL